MLVWLLCHRPLPPKTKDFWSQIPRGSGRSDLSSGLSGELCCSAAMAGHCTPPAYPAQINPKPNSSLQTALEFKRDKPQISPNPSDVAAVFWVKEGLGCAGPTSFLVQSLELPPGCLWHLDLCMMSWCSVPATHSGAFTACPKCRCLLLLPRAMTLDLIFSLLLGLESSFSSGRV